MISSVTPYAAVDIPVAANPPIVFTSADVLGLTKSVAATLFIIAPVAPQSSAVPSFDAL